MSQKSGRSKSKKKTAREGAKEYPTPLPGSPGYRTREGRSGYDPIDSRTEGAQMAGTFFRQFFTAQIKTQKPVYLFLLAFIGLLLLFPLLFTIFETVNGNPMPVNTWVWVTITGAVGVVALINFFRNLTRK